ncbi:hypothetical protein RHMOL_Rhmol03G0109200 [Rhododendron molle]|uniref:Uncharacterized protein n=1 Tax=Rhododendron molle TaxID=49168 RepID=A0ACC0PE30_RHOML|nr:hypothetical protein RHMOL_Rhmol03G0109200 [Rhododendron molle]
MFSTSFKIKRFRSSKQTRKGSGSSGNGLGRTVQSLERTRVGPNIKHFRSSKQTRKGSGSSGNRLDRYGAQGVVAVVNQFASVGLTTLRSSIAPPEGGRAHYSPVAGRQVSATSVYVRPWLELSPALMTATRSDPNLGLVFLDAEVDKEKGQPNPGPQEPSWEIVKNPQIRLKEVVGKVLISSRKVEVINEVIEVESKGKKFQVRVMEEQMVAKVADWKMKLVLVIRTRKRKVKLIDTGEDNDVEKQEQMAETDGVNVDHGSSGSCARFTRRKSITASH